MRSKATALRRLVVVVVRALRLTAPAFAAWERYRAARTRSAEASRTTPAGLALPPPLLMVKVAGDANPEEFLDLGQVGAEVIRASLRRHRMELEELDAFLDFGCGCGRVARHWNALQGPEIHGCDYNPALIRWCRENLPFMDARVNRLSPPLPYEDGKFDFVYALSVFTHLTEPLQHAWMAEMRRVIRPGGCLLFTTMGDKFRPALDHLDRSDLREAYDAGEFVVSDETMEGTNRCVAYHPHRWVIEQMLEGFELLEFAPQGSAMTGGQDYYLVGCRR